MNCDLLKESFKTKYEAFLTGCDAIELEDGWDVEEYGEMEVFYTNDLLSLILRLIATDGTVSQREADVLNELFGFDYTAEALAEVYEICKDNLSEGFDRLFEVGVDRLERINPKLAEAYKELLSLICTIVMESDGITAVCELSEIERLKKLCN